MPMLPHGATRLPAAASIVAVSCTVVVLPLVPVTRIHSAGSPTLSRRRQASSMSPQTGIALLGGPEQHGVVGVEARARRR